jgi:tRNA-dihydrouridine synthase B
MLDHLQNTPPFSEGLQEKINNLNKRKNPIQLNRIPFASPFLLAPMSSITKAPYRLLMEDLGSGGSISELISATGIFYKNIQTINMLYVDPRERHVGIQLFGDVADHMNWAALFAEEQGATFIDINMGCPVKKVVCKGAGSAMLKDPVQLGEFIRKVKVGLKIPLSIKIRTGWSDQNAHEVLKVAQDEGVEFVSIHGRTREQQYRGFADWDYIESLSIDKNNFQNIPIIGNGDLNSPEKIVNQYQKTKCQALMVGRGALRNPFIFLETYSLLDGGEPVEFTGEDYWEILNRFYYYLQQMEPDARKHIVQWRKFTLWMSSGLPNSVKFRGTIFNGEDFEELRKRTEDFFLGLGAMTKKNNLDEAFMNGGHG